ncbi:MAG: tetratricopeptide repeat protein [Leptothrix ochracea]|uniref:tetratricopeptide repeat protein n=1 Tax=Leptothrix ochracea TaxID=735331 RepID=UPI0034E1D7CB
MSQTLASLRHQLQQLKELTDAGALPATQYEESKAALERKVLELVMAGATESPAPVPAKSVARAAAVSDTVEGPTAKPSLTLVGGLVLAVALIGTAGYLWRGSPSGGAPATAAMGSAGEAAGEGSAQAGAPHEAGPDNQQFAAMVEKLAERLKAQPNDAEGWGMLGRSYNVLGRPEDALEAYAKSYKLNPKDASLLADYADALAVKNNRSLAGEPLKLIREALALDPNNIKALSLAGTEAFERKDYASAVKLWEKALSVAPGDASELIQQVQAGIDEARRLGNLGPAPAKTAAQPAVAVGKSVQGSVKLAPALVGKASPTDTVFIYARPAEGPRMPLAILRKQVKDLPFDFTLDDSLSMSPAARLSGATRVVVSARVSKTGEAMPQPGDLTGQTAPVAVGSTGLKVEITEVVGAK